MTAGELAEILGALQLDPFDLGALLNHDQRTVRKWLDGSTRIPPTAAILLRLLMDGTITVDHVRTASSPRDRRRRPPAAAK